MTHAMLLCRSVTLRYPGGPHALHDISLALDDGIVGLVGANGAGKSTLLRVIGGLLAPSAGEILVGGRRPAAHRVAFGIGHITDAPRLPDYLRVGEFLAGLRAAAGQPRISGHERRLHDALAIDELLPRPLAALSLGQRRRVELAAALIGDPDVLLLDEPTNGLDPLAMSALRRALLEARRPGRLIIVSSHHLDELQRLASWIVLLHEGRVAASTAGEDLRTRGTTLEDLLLQTAGAGDA